MTIATRAVRTLCGLLLVLVLSPGPASSAGAVTQEILDNFLKNLSVMEGKAAEAKRKCDMATYQRYMSRLQRAQRTWARIGGRTYGQVVDILTQIEQKLAGLSGGDAIHGQNLLNNVTGSETMADAARRAGKGETKARRTSQQGGVGMDSAATATYGEIADLFAQLPGLYAQLALYQQFMDAIEAAIERLEAIKPDCPKEPKDKTSMAIPGATPGHQDTGTAGACGVTPDDGYEEGLLHAARFLSADEGERAHMILVGSGDLGHNTLRDNPRARAALDAQSDGAGAGQIGGSTNTGAQDALDQAYGGGDRGVGPAVDDHDEKPDPKTAIPVGFNSGTDGAGATQKDIDTLYATYSDDCWTPYDSWAAKGGFWGTSVDLVLSDTTPSHFVSDDFTDAFDAGGQQVSGGYVPSNLNAAMGTGQADESGIYAGWAVCHRSKFFPTDMPPDGTVNLPQNPLQFGVNWDAGKFGDYKEKSLANLADNGLEFDPEEVKFGVQGSVNLGLNGKDGSYFYYGSVPEFSLGGSLACAYRMDAFIGLFTATGWEVAIHRESTPLGIGDPGGVQVAALTGPAAETGKLGRINDRLFNTKGSWGQDYDDQWGLKRIGFGHAGADGAGALWPRFGFPVTVAVVDTGLDRRHPDLVGATWVNTGETLNGKDDDGNGYIDDRYGWNFVDDDFDTWDDSGHGTFVAGIIAARTGNGVGIAGVNPWARVMPVKVTDFKHDSNSMKIAQGIYYAAEMGARVINVSIGGRKLTNAEQYSIEYAVDEGALVVVAAGNDNTDTADFSPAGLKGVITVAATGRDGKRAPYSNWGAQVDIAAPGDDILSLRAIQTDMLAFADPEYKHLNAIVGADNGYYRSSGTSFSAPFVSGVASLLLSINPHLKPDEVKRMILQSARDIAPVGADRFTGYGVLDARAAILADPNFFVEAAILGVEAVRGASGVLVRVHGTATADRFAKAWVEIGAGENPDEWKRIEGAIDTPVDGKALIDIPVKAFTGSKVWFIRLVTQHENGRKREARFRLQLG